MGVGSDLKTDALSVQIRGVHYISVLAFSSNRTMVSQLIGNPKWKSRLECTLGNVF